MFPCSGPTPTSPRDPTNTVSVGAYLSILCGDIAPFIDRNALTTLAGGENTFASVFAQPPWLGDAFYTPPGHIPVQNDPGTEFVSFSSSEELRTAEAVMMKNMQALARLAAAQRA